MYLWCVPHTPTLTELLEIGMSNTDQPRKPFAFKFSEPETYGAGIIEDFNYVDEHFDNPQSLNIDYDGWFFEYHLNLCLYKRIYPRDCDFLFDIEHGSIPIYGIVPNKSITSVGDIKKTIEYLTEYYGRIGNTQIEPFRKEISDELIKWNIILNNYNEAYNWMQRWREISSFEYGWFNNDYISFKQLLNLPLIGDELLGQPTISYYNITKFTKDHLDEFYILFNRCFDQVNKPNLLDDFSDGIKYSTIYSFEQYGNIRKRLRIKPKVDFFSSCLYANENYLSFVQSLCRQAENLLRDKYKLKPVGEEWISETILYYNIKERFAKSEVIHSYRSKWLGLQHIDIYFKKEKVAIEYQGEQHYKPIAKFGGDDTFIETQRRDYAKVEKCCSNGVIIVHVTPEYDINVLHRTIEQLLIRKIRPQGVFVVGKTVDFIKLEDLKQK